MTSVLIFSDNESSSGTKEQEEIGIQPDFVTHVDIRATELAAMPVPTPRTIQPTDAESCTPGLDIDQTQQPQERSFFLISLLLYISGKQMIYFFYFSKVEMV